MPFVYYGGKKGSAHRYPPPAFPTIIEPFAGSAGYALAWAKPSTRVILVEKDPVVAALWRRLQEPDAAALIASVECPPVGEQSGDVIVALTAGSYPDANGAPGGRIVTTRIARDFGAQRRRILSALPVIQRWEIVEGDYTDAPDDRATWFVDPPYAPRGGRDPGAMYRAGSGCIDYSALGEWCRARRGQVIVCEQEGADWLPFRPLFTQHSQSGQGEHPPRVEVVWTRTPGTSMPGTASSRRAEQLRKERRRARAGR